MEEVEENCHPDECPIIIVFPPSDPGNSLSNQASSVRYSAQLTPSNFMLTSETAESVSRECRICLEGEDECHLGKYCRCTGTAELCHEECLG